MSDTVNNSRLDAGFGTFAEQVEVEAKRLRVQHAARVLVAAEEAAAIPAPPFDADLLRDVLAREPAPPPRVQELIPAEAGTLVVAQRKTGKTTLLLNLARSLVTGEPFLGTFAVRAVTGNVGFLNFEVSAAQVARWAAEVGVPVDRLFLVNLRGRRNPLTDEEQRADLAALLRRHRVEVLMVDPFGRAYTGTSQNDAGEVGAWLAELDRFTREQVGATDLVLSTHAGWNQERSRGASALEDWADSVLTLTRENDDDRYRFLRATGRDVDVEEDGLHFDPSTRLLTMSGIGSRKTAAESRHLDHLVQAVVQVVNDRPGVNRAGLMARLREQGVPFQDGQLSRAASLAEDRGLIITESLGTGRATLHHPATPANPCQPPPANGS